MADTGNFESQAAIAAHDRKARSRKFEVETPLGDVFVGYRYIKATIGFGRTTVWRKEHEGTFPKGTIVGNKRSWRKSVIDAERDRLIPAKSEA
jgi:predicted DNA-binding transcriptional regulator AlpA